SPPQYVPPGWNLNTAEWEPSPDSNEAQPFRDPAERIPVGAGEAEAERRPGRSGPEEEDGNEAHGAVEGVFGEPHRGDSEQGDGEAEEELSVERGEAVGDLELEGRGVGDEDGGGGDGDRHPERALGRDEEISEQSPAGDSQHAVDEGEDA